MSVNGNGFTDLQKNFIYEYCKCLRPKLAAERAGYKGNARTLSAVGVENLAKPSIKAAIEQLFVDYAMSAGEVVHRIGVLAKDEEEVVKPNDKLKALELIGKVHGVFDTTGTKERPLHIKVSGLDDTLKSVYGEQDD